MTIDAAQTAPDGTVDTWEIQTHRRSTGGEVPLAWVLDLAEMGAPKGLVGHVLAIGPTPEINSSSPARRARRSLPARP